MSPATTCSRCRTVAPTYQVHGKDLCALCLPQATDGHQQATCRTCGAGGLSLDDLALIEDHGTGTGVCWGCHFN